MVEPRKPGADSASEEEAAAPPAPPAAAVPPSWRLLPWALTPALGVLALTLSWLHGSLLIAAAGMGFLMAGAVAETFREGSLLQDLLEDPPPRPSGTLPRVQPPAAGSKAVGGVPAALARIEEFPPLAEPEPALYQRDTSRIHYGRLDFELTRKATALKVSSAKDRLAQKLGQEGLDRAFEVHTNDLDFVREWVGSEHVARILLELRRLVGESRLEVRLEDGRFRVTSPGLPREWCRELFLERAEWLADRLSTMMVTRRILAGRGPRPDAPLAEDAFEVLAATAAGEARCKICGEAIEHEVIRCRRCETPHHLACWEYNDGCSVYGCRSRRFQPDADP